MYYSNKPFSSRLWLNVWGPRSPSTRPRDVSVPPVHLYIIAGQRREMPPICTSLRMRKKRRISFNSGGRKEGRKDGGRQLFKLIVRRWRGRPRLPLPSLPGIEGLLICFTRLRNRLFLLLGKPGPHKTASRLASCMASASEQGFIHNQFILNLFSYLASARNLTRRPNRIECLVTSLASIEVGLRKAFNENLEVGQQLSYQNFKMKLYWKTRFIFFG